MVEYLKDTLVNSKKWIDTNTFSKGLVTCQAIPGAIMVNLTAYCGYYMRGLKGMLTAFTAFLLPSFLLMILFSYFYMSSRDLEIIKSIFKGLEVIVVAIVINAGVRFSKDRLQRDKKAIIFALISAILLFFKINPLFVIMLMALIGICSFKGHKLEIDHMETKKPSKYEIIFLLAITVIYYVIVYSIGDDLLILSYTMTKIALMSFGGVYTALPLMYHETVEALRWMSSKTFMDGIALGQVTPGPILINAVFVGYVRCGIWGGIIGAFSIFGPGLLLVSIMMHFISKVESSSYFRAVTQGMITAFAGLLIYIAIKFFVEVQWDYMRIFLLTGSLIWLFIKNDVLTLVVVGAVISTVVF